MKIFLYHDFFLLFFAHVEFILESAREHTSQHESLWQMRLYIPNEGDAGICILLCTLFSGQ